MKGNFTGIMLVAIAAGMVAVGCGSEKIEQASAGSTSTPAVTAQSSEPVLPAPSAEVAPQGESTTSTPPDGPAPEVAVSVSDTLVVPGGVVELIANASEDVVEVSLKDDLGRKQPFAYDAERKSWRTSYRVPMRMPSERLALSVTARNDSHRWHRVWVFLGVRPEGSVQ